VDNRRVAWVTRLAQVFWGVVEVAVPGNFWNQFFHHVVHLLYAFEAFLIVGGVLLVDANIQRFGLISLAVTAAAHVAVKALGDYMRGKGHKFWRALVSVFWVLAGAAILTSAVLGLPALQNYWRKLSDGLLTVTAIKRLHALPSEARALVLFGAGALAVVVVAVAVGGSWQAVKEFAASFGRGARAVYYRVRGRAGGESAEVR
jgi:TRAP-type C4-dicarboxylate transport system permease small subunit